MGLNIQPVAGYLVVQAEEAITKTASGILLPDQAKEKPKTAKVLAVGEAVGDIKPGDRIIYKNEYDTTTVTQNGEDFILVEAKNVIAKVK